MAEIDRVREIKADHEDELLGYAGVVGVDIASGADGDTHDELAIRVYVTDPDAAADLPDRLDGIPIVVSPLPGGFSLHGNDEGGRPDGAEPTIE
jgi:hypothetical protein